MNCFPRTWRGGGGGVLTLLPSVQEVRPFLTNTESQGFESVSEGREVQDRNLGVHLQGSLSGARDGVPI